MNQVVQLLQRLRLIGEELPIEERPKFLPGASPDAIAALEAVLPAPLPDDFRQFLQICDTVSAMDIWNGYWIGCVSGIKQNVNRGDTPATIPGNDGSIAVVPIASDGGGSAFLMSLEAGTVWKRDRETGRLMLVAGNFAGFLERVAEDWEHFVDGDYAWDFLTG